MMTRSRPVVFARALVLLIALVPVSVAPQGLSAKDDEIEQKGPDIAVLPAPPPLAPAANDQCVNAIGPLAVPSTTAGTTVDSGVDSEAPFCGTSVTSPGVWYTVEGTGNTITASLCNGQTNYDAKLSTYCTGCGNFQCVTGRDDFCGLQPQISWCSQAGVTYHVLVHGFGGASGPFELVLSDDGQPCIATVQCVREGGCCLADGTCADLLTQATCEDQGGEYQGDDAICAGGVVQYTLTQCSAPLEDISGTGVAGPAGDDQGQVVPIGFDFTFFGIPRGGLIGMSTNGYLTFGDDRTDFSNDPIPTTTDPNDLIAPLWDDFVVDGAGVAHYETLGAAPARRFIAQWTGVRQFGQSDSNTFQAVLEEGTNCIFFRYGPFTAQSSSGDYTIGLENNYGTDGIGVDAALVAPDDCLRFCPEFTDPIVCQAMPAPAPTLSLPALGFSLLLLAGVSAFGIRRLRRGR